MTQSARGSVPPSIYTPIWGGLNAALVLSCIRSHGSEEAEAVEHELGKRLTAFRLHESGLRGTGSVLQSCANLQVASDRRQGRPVFSGAHEGAVWVVYPGAHWLSHAPQPGATMPTVIEPALQAAHYQSRHGEIARRLGGGDVRFVLTHSLAEGDPCDAGYFASEVTGGVEGAEVSRSKPAWLVDMTRVLDDPAVFEPASTGRDGGTLSHEVGLRIQVLCERMGPPGGSLLVEHALRILLAGYREWLPGALDQPVVRTPDDAATLYARFWETAGAQVVVSRGIRPVVSLRLADLWPDTGTFPPLVSQAIVRAWSASLSHLDFNLRCWIASPPEEDQERFVVEFDAGGPGT